jgi:hypothetical protein
MQPVDVLRREQEAGYALLELGDGRVRGIGLDLRHHHAPLLVPVPDELRIARERFRCCKLARVVSGPQTRLRIAERRHT